LFILYEQNQERIRTENQERIDRGTRSDVFNIERIDR